MYWQNVCPEENTWQQCREYNGNQVCGLLARQAADPGRAAASAEGGQPPRADLHPDDQDAGRPGGLPQPPRPPVPPPGRNHPRGATTGQSQADSTAEGRSVTAEGRLGGVHGLVSGRLGSMDWSVAGWGPWTGQ